MINTGLDKDTSMHIEQILHQQFNELQLKGFREGVTDPSEEKFFAYSILSVKDDSYEDIYRLHLQAKGNSCMHSPGLSEKLKNYNTDGSYSYKSIEQCITEELYQYVVIQYCGCFYEKEWYVQDEVFYYEAGSQEEVEQKMKDLFKRGNELWNSFSFLPLAPYYEMIDEAAIRTELSKRSGIQDPSSWSKTSDQVYEFAKTLPADQLPKKKIPQPAYLRLFIGQPWMVAYIKKESREKTNRSYEQYINETIFIPVITALKAQRPEDFYTAHTLYSPIYYPLIYPHSKDYVIAVIKTTGYDKAAKKETNSRLYYLLYHPGEKKLYEWTRPVARAAGGFHVFYIQEDLNGLSDWGNDFDIFEPSVTMDDLNFWNEFVFKKENEKYLFLKEVHVKNNRKDIYPDF